MSLRIRKKLLCANPALLQQEVWIGLKEILAVLRLDNSTLRLWRSRYGLPVARPGHNLVTTKSAIAHWIEAIARAQNESKRDEGNKKTEKHPQEG